MVQADRSFIPRDPQAAGVTTTGTSLGNLVIRVAPASPTPCPPVEGTVLDSRGEPLEGIKVRFRGNSRPGRGPRGACFPNGVTRSDGTFRLTEPEEPYLIHLFLDRVTRCGPGIGEPGEWGYIGQTGAGGSLVRARNPAVGVTVSGADARSIVVRLSCEP